MSVASWNDKAALLVAGMLGYLANHAVAELNKNIARIEAHVAIVDSISQDNLKSLVEIRAYLRQRKILPP